MTRKRDLAVPEAYFPRRTRSGAQASATAKRSHGSAEDSSDENAPTASQPKRQRTQRFTPLDSDTTTSRHPKRLSTPNLHQRSDAILSDLDGEEGKTAPKAKRTTRSADRKNAVTRGTPKPGSKAEAIDGSYKRGLHEDLAPLHEIQEIFEDMTAKAYNDLGLKDALKHLKGRKLRVATMCSGTESPLLALGMISDALKSMFGDSLQVEHQFSAEIVPFKQAYIERNFHPKILFRDILEIAEKKEASTAYGCPSEIPPDVDMLVVGFSCVDFSGLNNKKKALNDAGESGDTFRAILKYARKFRPPIIILENIIHAPWELIKAIWENDQPALRKKNPEFLAEWGNFWDKDEPAYSAHHIKVDSKLYYIPQTRQRVYMVCIDGKQLPNADAKTEQWGSIMKKLERPASSSIEAFLLPEDDCRLQRARNEYCKTSRGRAIGRRDVEWTLCQGRYQDYRTSRQLGVERPLTNWVDGGSCKAPDYWWQDYAVAQVERLWDTFEISFLRNAVGGFDSQFKTRVWELSQNVDRFTDSTPFGISGCITPSGQPFLTSRGGPLLGLEAMSMQGLPIDRLLLTRETQRELQDLAGNAMTSTVVGAAMLSAFIVSSKAIDRGSRRIKDASTIAASDPRKIASSILQRSLPLDLTYCKPASVAALCQMAKDTIRLCSCESPVQITFPRIRTCQDCSHTACEECRGTPAHNYKAIEHSPTQVRSDPQSFIREVKQALPMRLQFSKLNLDDLSYLQDEDGYDLDLNDWRIYREAVGRVIGEELRYTSATRSHCWTVTYHGIFSWLDLVFDNGTVQWELYIIPDRKEPGNSRTREVFKHPVARMNVTSEELFSGNWELRVPATATFDVTISGKGELTRSWEARLGLQMPRAADKKVWTYLHVAVDSSKSIPQLDHDISGEYKLLQKCGMASSSLHKKISTPHSEEQTLYLFLDPDSIGDPTDDPCVFSTDKHRLKYQETRHTVAHLESSWRPSAADVSQAKCTVYGRWMKCRAVLQAFQSPSPARFSVAAKDFGVPIATGITSATPASYHCAEAVVALLSCKVPLKAPESVPWRQGPWRLIDQINERQTFSRFAWLTERVRNLDAFAAVWRGLELPKCFYTCKTCVPEPADIQWRYEIKSNKVHAIAYENEQQAGVFERALKARPSPFVVHTRIDENLRGRLVVGLNVSVLGHRALARFGYCKTNEGMTLSWRLDTQYDRPSGSSLPTFILKSNQDEVEALHVFTSAANPVGANVSSNVVELRKEQKRSLTWMIGQEDDDAPCFVMEEAEEATMPQLGWRAEVRATKACSVKGGVLADEVGYGKTATILALIDSQMSKAIASGKISYTGKISLKATLIIVPGTLIHQWVGQVEKFLGKDCNVVQIKDMIVLAQLTIAKLQEADIILVSWSLFSSDAYMRKLAQLAALPDSPSPSGRAHDAWLARACDRIAVHIEGLKTATIPEFAKTLDARLQDIRNDKDLLHSVPTKRYKGKEYAARALERKNNEGTDFDIGQITSEVDQKTSEVDQKNSEIDQKASEINRTTSAFDMKKAGKTDPFGLAKATSIGDIKTPLLQIFQFSRLVVDEYTYVKGTEYSFVASLAANSRWVLSGTPPLDDFADVKLLAGFLRINLGVDDAAAGVSKGYNISNIRKDRTAAEKFQAFGEVHTPAWHQSRQEYAQKFLDQFARQNTAEIGEIKYEEILRPITLPAAERAVFMELQQQIQAQDLKVTRGGKARNDGDRALRMKALLNSSETPEEALLKCCSFFGLEGVTASNPCAHIVQERLKQKDELSQELQTTLKHAAWLNRQCQKSADPRIQDVHYNNWKKNVERHSFGDLEATTHLLDMIKDAEASYQYEHQDDFYRNPPTPAEIQLEKAELVERRKAETAAKALKRKEAKKIAQTGTDKLKGKTSGVSKRASRSKAPKRTMEPKIDIDSTNAQVAEGDKRPQAEESVLKDAANGSDGFDPEAVEDNHEHSKGSESYNGRVDKIKIKTLVEEPVLIEYGTAQIPEELPEAEQQQEDQAKDKEVSEPEFDDAYVQPNYTKAVKIASDDFTGMICALRALSGHLRSLTVEFVSRTRALRFFESVRQLQLWQSDVSENGEVHNVPKCAKCDHEAQDSVEISVLGICGHLACNKCLQSPERDAQCVSNKCGAAVYKHHIHGAKELGAEEHVSVDSDSQTKEQNSTSHGSKLDAIIRLIRGIPKDDQVLLFVQFDNLMVKIANALNEAEISNWALQNDKVRAAAFKMQSFQEETGESKRKVMILNSSNESAAGANLTMANHIIFVSPFLAATQHAFKASLTQCIGRARRYGQTKKVFIYKFLALKTIDVDILQERTGMRLVNVTREKDKDETWTLKRDAEMSPKEREVQWGSDFMKSGYLDVGE